VRGKKGRKSRRSGDCSPEVLRKGKKGSKLKGKENSWEKGRKERTLPRKRGEVKGGVI